jgi:transposase
MDNPFIQEPIAVREFVQKRGYKYVYLPPYSPFFLNTIEEIWSIVKYGAKRRPFDISNTLIL